MSASVFLKSLTISLQILYTHFQLKMSSSSDENLRIIFTAFPNLSPDEASNLNVMQSTLLNKQLPKKRRSVDKTTGSNKVQQEVPMAKDVG